MRGRSHSEREAGLEVGLFKHGKHPPGIRNLELGVEVDLLVHRIHEPVQALAGIHVGGLGDHHQLVVRCEIRQLDADSVGDRCRVQLAAVQFHAVHRVGHRVDERRGTRHGRELHSGGGAEDFPSAGQVELDLVGFDGDQFGALACFGARQVHSGQGEPPGMLCGWANKYCEIILSRLRCLASCVRSHHDTEALITRG
ncbi:hypothetical protein BJQ89_01702 [Arthrobacter sp. ES1]|nr:hypothetical protein [Arthrobacter sp. ES1]